MKRTRLSKNLRMDEVTGGSASVSSMLERALVLQILGVFAAADGHVIFDDVENDIMYAAGELIVVKIPDEPGGFRQQTGGSVNGMIR